MVRVKVACKNSSKIPPERLFEMNKKLFLVSFTVEGEEFQAGNNGDENGGDDGDNDDGDEKKDNENMDKQSEDPGRQQQQPGNVHKTPAFQQNTSKNVGHKTVSCQKVRSGTDGFPNQDKQLIWAMEDMEPKMWSDQGWMYTGECSVVKESFGCMELTPGQDVESMLTDELSKNDVSVKVASLIVKSNEGNSVKTPAATQLDESDCNIVGNKFYKLINEESHLSKWEEFRKAAREGGSEECSLLLRRMELEDSDEEYDLLDDVEENLEDGEEMIALSELDLTKDVVEGDSEPVDEHIKRDQKRKTKWGPVERISRPRRGQDDGCTMLEKAQKLKAIRNLEKGNIPKSFAFESNASLLQKAQCVNINLGTDPVEVNRVIDNLKEKELLNCESFMEGNPEVNLPGDLELDVTSNVFPALKDSIQTPLKGNVSLGNQSWAQVVSTGKAQISEQKRNNDRSILEC